MADAPVHTVAIVVDPRFGERLIELLDRMPVWIADTADNRSAVALASVSLSPSGPQTGHTLPGAVTTFTIDPDSTPESWCIGILGTVAGHHDRYSHSPGYSALEIYGVEPTSALVADLADYRLTEIVKVPGGFRAATSDGQPAASPNDE